MTFYLLVRELELKGRKHIMKSIGSRIEGRKFTPMIVQEYVLRINILLKLFENKWIAI